MDPPAIAAATLIPFRPGAEADEHLMVERAANMVFAGGAMVFPGGRVDPGDHALARRLPHLDPEDAAARIAAIRETVEEAGIAVGLTPLPPAEVIAVWRAQLAAGIPFEALLDVAGCTLDGDALTLFARWCPKFHQSRNFDTRFYVAQLPNGAPAAAVDATENVRLTWSTAQAIIDLAEAGEVSVIFPTRRNLERLAALSRFDRAVAQAASTPIELITPQIETIDGERWLTIPEGLGYPITRERFERAVRGGA